MKTVADLFSAAYFVRTVTLSIPYYLDVVSHPLSTSIKSILSERAGSILFFNVVMHIVCFAVAMYRFSLNCCRPTPPCLFSHYDFKCPDCFSWNCSYIIVYSLKIEESFKETAYDSRQTQQMHIHRCRLYAGHTCHIYRHNWITWATIICEAMLAIHNKLKSLVQCG